MVPSGRALPLPNAYLKRHDGDTECPRLTTNIEQKRPRAGDQFAYDRLRNQCRLLENHRLVQELLKR
jgi:hypothetical protein